MSLAYVSQHFHFHIIIGILNEGRVFNTLVCFAAFNDPCREISRQANDKDSCTLGNSERERERQREEEEQWVISCPFLEYI